MLCVGFVSRHLERDLSLPVHRNKLLDNALKDLTADTNVLAIYLGGSLAKKNFDNYSDIDLHTIVKPEKRTEFIRNKRSRAEKWGDALYHENANPFSPVVVTHYNCFVKVDSWYHAPEEVEPSIWLKGLQVLYDPTGIISAAITESADIEYKLSTYEVELWRGKILAFAHETYRAVMRNEPSHADFNIDRVRWLIVSGWYMEMEEHFDASYGSWSKVEGDRSILSKRQLSLLEKWRCNRETMETIVMMIPEIFRLNKTLSNMAEIEKNENLLKKGFNMIC